MNAPRHPGIDQPTQLVEARQLCTNVLEPQDPPPLPQRCDDVVEFALLDEAAGGDDGFDPGQFAGRLQVLEPGREVQEGWNAPECIEPEQSDGDGLNVRQQHADRFALIRQARKPAAENERPQDKAAEGDRLTFEVLEGDLVPTKPIPRFEESAEEAVARPRDIELRHGRSLTLLA